MDNILTGYHVNSATWFYLSFLLIVAVFFRFGRFWSVRNLDLALLLSLSPGLLLVEEHQLLGFGWLFVVTGLLLLRLFCDGLLKRRPRLEQNLNVPGLVFLGLSALAFLMTKVITDAPPAATVETAREAEHLLDREDASSDVPKASPAGPATPLLTTVAVLGSKAVAAGNGTGQPSVIEEVAPRIMAILSHLAVISGLIVLSAWHFGDIRLGLAVATLYLLLPCTAHDVGKVNHVLPAALIVWSLAAYRRPIVAGGMMGLACGSLFFPIFLLPLWAVFYNRRGALRFGLALAIVGAVLLSTRALTSANPDSFIRQTFRSIDWSVVTFQGGDVAGFWSLYDAAYRMPVFVTFFVILCVLTVWPRKKTVEHLLAHSTAIIVAIQFWYPKQGGVYLLWYLPLLLLVVFRPRLSHLLPPESKPASAESHNTPEPARRQLASTGTATGHLFR